ncbi:hypothetical protein [Kitasatospora sp. NPDC058478]|uniref:hypothetical protein n=1 Tax=unclassified Kitasatospora TaxID=2633591 RepID=UPI003648D7CD
MSRIPFLRRLAVRALAVTVITAGVWLPAAPQASAAVLDASCLTGTNAVSYTPGITDQTQQIGLSFTGSSTSCVFSDLSVHTVSFSGTGAGSLSCLVGSFTASGNALWDGKDTSTFTVSSTIDVGGGLAAPVAVATGTFTSGKFAGDSIEVTLELIPDNPLGCVDGQGVTSTTGGVTFIATHF